MTSGSHHSMANSWDPTLCDPIDGSPPGSSIPGTLQARTLEWVAISFSNAWKWKLKVKLLSCVRLVATPWTAAYQAPPSKGLSRQECWSGVPLPVKLEVAKWSRKIGWMKAFWSSPAPYWDSLVKGKYIVKSRMEQKC